LRVFLVMPVGSLKFLQLIVEYVIVS
jgi:hypothetical protein